MVRQVRETCNGLLTKMKEELGGRGQLLFRNAGQWQQEISEIISDSSLLDTMIGVIGDTGR